jgi:60 kDa SS-A/Ro ribonucleoprotein
MAINYAKLFNRRVTPQSQAIPGSTQVRNSAGGFSWEVDDWTRLDRFLILGAEGGTYYISERELVKQNHDALVRCIKADGVRAVNRIVEISDSGRAPKNDPAIFAMASGGRARQRRSQGARRSRTSARSAASARTCSTSRST